MLLLYCIHAAVIAYKITILQSCCFYTANMLPSCCNYASLQHDCSIKEYLHIIYCISASVVAYKITILQSCCFYTAHMLPSCFPAAYLQYKEYLHTIYCTYAAFKHSCCCLSKGFTHPMTMLVTPPITLDLLRLVKKDKNIHKNSSNVSNFITSFFFFNYRTSLHSNAFTVKFKYFMQICCRLQLVTQLQIIVLISPTPSIGLPKQTYENYSNAYSQLLLTFCDFCHLQLLNI